MTITLPFTTKLAETSIAIDAAIQAGKDVMKIYESEFNSSLKKDNEPITEADIKSNETIHNMLSKTNIPLLSEEDADNNRLIHDKIWIVDPLDGTSDFINKTGEFTIMIALVYGHKPVLGIIYWPTKNKLYVAQKKEGAYQLVEKKWKKLSVSDISSLEKCRVVGSRYHLSEPEKKFINTMKKVLIQRGSSLKIIDICSGDAELYFTTTNKIKQWDTCASYCLITEAGGKMTDMKGEELEYNTYMLNHENGILSTNGLLHNTIIESYSKFLKQYTNIT